VAAAMCMAVGKVSLELWNRHTTDGFTVCRNRGNSQENMRRSSSSRKINCYKV
jgi:hypothetical protein